LATTDDYAGNTSTTGRLTTTAPVYGVINFVGDTDWFRIYLSNTTTYVFDQVQTPVNEYYNLDSYLRIFDSSNNQLASNDDGGGYRNAKITFTPSSSDYYYLSAEGNYWWIVLGQPTGPYRLTAYEVNHAPVVSGKSSVSVTAGQQIPASSLFSASDQEGNSNIVTYEFYYASDRAGHLSWSNSSLVTHDSANRTLIVPASALSTVSYTGDINGAEDMLIAAYDGTLWSNWGSAHINVSQANRPPVLDAAASPTLTGISRDVTNPVGSTVAQIVVNGSISDADTASPVEAIVIESVNSSLGTWQFSINNGSTWQGVTGVTTSHGLALGPTSLVRLLPNGSASGTSNFTFRAWDQTDGAASGAYITYTAGIGSVSFVSDTATIVVGDSGVQPKRTAGEIFNAVGTGVEVAGIVRTLADFSKAAYSLQSWEDRTINDYMPNSDQAKAAVVDQGWVPLELSIPSLTTTSSVGNRIVSDGMSGGFYTHGNAAAFVAYSKDAIVIAFRGTNDNASQYAPNQNPNDVANTVKPDVDQWGDTANGKSMQDHYGLLSDLITAVDKWVDQHSSIDKVYVTGHSLGGAMAIKYMEDNHPFDPKYQAITFAAPAFTDSPYKVIPHREGFSAGDTRLTQIELAGDPVPGITWDLISRPGKQLLFTGNQTGDTPDTTAGVFRNNTDNHSMDYYRQITKSVDPASWQILLDLPRASDVLIGASSGPFLETSPVRSDSDHPKTADQYDTYFIVDGNASGYIKSLTTSVAQFKVDSVATNELAPLLSSGIPVFDGVNVSMGTISASNFLSAKNGKGVVIYGGNGDDVLNGGTGGQLLLGGIGEDIIRASNGNDTLVGGAGNDALDGGDGVDTAVYFGAREQYAVTKTASGLSISSSEEGSDVLTNVERIQFKGGSLAFDMGVAQHGGESVLLLGAVLGKQALTKSLVGQGISLFDSGYTMQQLSTLIMGFDIWGGLANPGHTTANTTQIANYLLTTVNGSAPDATTLSNAVFSLNYDLVGNFLAQLAVSAANQSQVGLVGLAQTGLEFQPG